jgi:hypothetical protein
MHDERWSGLFAKAECSLQSRQISIDRRIFIPRMLLCLNESIYQSRSNLACIAVGKSRQEMVPNRGLGVAKALPILLLHVSDVEGQELTHGYGGRDNQTGIDIRLPSVQ